LASGQAEMSVLAPAAELVLVVVVESASAAV
jgi:hypothetical protein